MVLTSTTALLAASLSLSSVVDCLPSFGHSKQSHYPGWAGIKHIFTFGDSYTTTGFNESLAQPSQANPLGNPAYPGYTSSNGPNWVDYITTTYNKSFIETINLAYGGATVDAALVEAYLPTVLSVKQQVQDEYLPTYASSPSFFPWKTDDTLFAVFIGINDVGNSYAAKNASLQPIIFEEYAGLVDQLYTSGARNFLFLNVPPVNRSPLTVAAGASSQALEAEAIAEWNARVYLLSKNLTHAHRDVTTFVFDTNSLFNRVLDYPCVSPITCPYKNTTDYCVAYENGTPTPTSFNATCGISVDKYFWLNSLHPTFRMQQLLASEIVKQLS